MRMSATQVKFKDLPAAVKAALKSAGFIARHVATISKIKIQGVENGYAIGITLDAFHSKTLYITENGGLR